MGVEGRGQTGRAVKTRPRASEADPRGTEGRQRGHTCRTAMSGAARSQRGSRWLEHSDRDGWMGEEKACGREKACRGGHKACALGERNSLRQRGAIHRKGGPR